MGREPAPRSAEQLSSVLVFGGGLAGMTAALRLVQAGHQVTLVERRPYLGGRAYSFTDRETGQEVDNGQHVFLGCCTAYASLLRDIGTIDLTSRQQRLRVEVRSPSGKTGVLSALPLPSPLHLVPSFIRYPHLSFREKVVAVPALLRIKGERDRNRPELRGQSFHDWLTSNGQTGRAIENFWDLIILPSLNDASRDVSASMGFMVFQVALLWDKNGGNVGYARAGLSDIMGRTVQRLLEEAGATLLLGTSVEHITTGPDDAVTGIELADGESLESDWYVSALPPDALTEVLSDADRRRPELAHAATHTYAPIVNLHIWYDRPIGAFDFLAFVDSPVQWVFNRTRIAGLNGPGQYITVSLSGAWKFWPATKEALRERFVPELARLFPDASNATVERFIVVKEQHATFRSLPGGPDNRLPARSPLKNLVLAGDWTDTGWPSTMESAVRSGNAASNLVVSEIGKGGA